MLAQLNGLFRPDYAVAERVMMHIGEAREGAMPWGSGPVAQIQDARPLQVEVGDAAVFFHQRGFVLLPHRSGVED
jgi:hypothetical protein